MSADKTSGVPTWARTAWFLLLAALAFGGLSYLSLNFAGEVERHVSAVWPASGLAMAIIFFGGNTFWVAIFLASLVSNGITTWQEYSDFPAWRVVLASSGIAAGAALEALAAAWFLRNRAGGQEFCLSATHATAFVLRVALISASMSALIGPSFLMFSGVFGPEKLGLAILIWFVGDATGILIFGAALVFPWRSIDYEQLRERWVELLLLFLTQALVGGTMTGIYDNPGAKQWPREYMILPVILWAVFRFNHLGTLASLLFVSVLSLGGSAFGHQVFPSDQEGYSLVFLQMFLLIVSSAAWAVCGRVNELQILSSRLEELVASQIVTQRETLRRKEERLAVVAHDLQVPLIGIRNLVQLLLNRRQVGDDPDKVRQLLTQVGEASEQARSLAERLLDEQEVEQARPRPEPVDWVELIRGVAQRASLLEVSRELRFVAQTEQPEITGSVDRMVVLQVLENLCQNAAKVSPRGGAVTLGLRVEGEVVIITLADEGPGFRPEEIPSLFNKSGFRRRLRTQPGSSGLGLFIVGKAVRELGGTITCESREGSGAVFTIRLPRTVR
ncbi:MAG: MASE1 domain-containing protein [Verrucomicrobiales bacterium]